MTIRALHRHIPVLASIGLICTLALAGLTAASPPAGASSAPINIGQVGAYTGPASGGLAGVGDGLQAWVKYVNAHGGVSGHKIDLFVGDCRTKPAETSQIVQIASEDNVVGFAGMATFDVNAALSDLSQKGIPSLAEMPKVGFPPRCSIKLEHHRFRRTTGRTATWRLAAPNLESSIAKSHRDVRRFTISCLTRALKKLPAETRCFPTRRR